jgi:hypothetical protein
MAANATEANHGPEAQDQVPRGATQAMFLGLLLGVGHASSR